jgi:hypothetical protein
MRCCAATVWASSVCVHCVGRVRRARESASAGLFLRARCGMWMCSLSGRAVEEGAGRRQGAARCYRLRVGGCVPQSPVQQLRASPQHAQPRYGTGELAAGPLSAWGVVSANPPAAQHTGCLCGYGAGALQAARMHTDVHACITPMSIHGSSMSEGEARFATKRLDGTSTAGGCWRRKSRRDGAGSGVGCAERVRDGGAGMGVRGGSWGCKQKRVATSGRQTAKPCGAALLDAPRGHQPIARTSVR